MATYSSLGVGSGLDLQGLLTKLMTVERSPVTALQSKISTTNTKISAFGTLQSKLSALQTAADDLRFSSRLTAKTATSSESAIASATANTSALNGSYSLNVTQLASAQKSFTEAYASGTTFAQGSLTFTVGTTSSTITMDDQTSYTLSEVADRINTANVGVGATVITDDSGNQRMVLSGEKTGGGNGFTLTSTMSATGTGSQASLGDFDVQEEGEEPDGLMRQTAKNAEMTIDGIAVSSSTNTFDSALAGVTINASKAGTSTLTVANDNQHVIDSAKAFVDAYNAVVTNISSNVGFNEGSSTGKVFSGDFAIRAVSDGLRSVRMTEPSEVSNSSFKKLSDLGISVQQDGSLKLDSTTLTTALNTSTKDVITTLNAYGRTFSEEISNKISSGGVFGQRVDNLNLSVKGMQTNIEKLEARLALTEKRYRAQFSALDQFVSSMQSTSTYLAQQLSSLQSSSS